MLAIDLSDKVAIVTGGGKNIGRAIATSLASHGANVALTWRSDRAAAETVVGEITENGGRAMALELDLVDPLSIAAGVAEIRSALGPVQILVNNAASRPAGHFFDISPEVWDAVYAVNVRAPFLLTQHVAPDMVAAHWGRVICIGGISAYIGRKHRPHVVSSKLAVTGLVRAIAAEFLEDGITANVVVPGTIETVRADQTGYPELPERLTNIPMNRLGTATEVANYVTFLASDFAGYTTGQEHFVSGGAFPLYPHR